MNYSEANAEQGVDPAGYFSDREIFITVPFDFMSLLAEVIFSLIF
jgi:hypothetical protein